MKLLFLLLFLSLFGNKMSDTGIAYRTLSWSDFRGPIPLLEESSPWAAEAVTGIEFWATQEDGKINYIARACFLPDSSWVRVRTDACLMHEQTHFKITYIASLRLLRDLAPLQAGNQATIKKAEKLYDVYCQEKNSVNAQFDKETDHGRNEGLETFWENKMSGQLSALRKEN